MAAKSSSRQQAQQTRSYHSASISSPKVMLVSTVPVTIRGSYSASTISVSGLQKRVPSWMDISPRIASSSEVLPEPTAPITATLSTFLSLILTSLRIVVSSSESDCSPVNSSFLVSVVFYHEAQTSLNWISVWVSSSSMWRRFAKVFSLVRRGPVITYSMRLLNTESVYRDSIA